MYNADYHLGEIVVYSSKPNEKSQFAKIIQIKLIDKLNFKYGLILLDCDRLQECWTKGILYADSSQIRPLITRRDKNV